MVDPPDDPQRTSSPQIAFDIPGALCLMVAVATTLFGLETVGRQPRPWSSTLLWPFGLAAVAAVALIWFESHAEEPILPPRLFRNRTFVGGNLVNATSSLCQIGIFAFLPLMLQHSFGLDPLMAGIVLAPSFVAVPLTVMACSRFTHRTGRYRLFPILGTALMTAALAAFAYLPGDGGLWRLLVLAAVFSAGSGMVGTTLLIAIQSVTPGDDLGVATAAFVVFRNLGGTIGTGIVGPLLLSGDHFSRLRARPARP